MRYLAIALRFLTPFSIGKVEIIKDNDLARSMAWFGFVGCLIGLVSAFANTFFSLFLSRQVTSALIVLFMFALSGGLHSDGLADTVDGLAGSNDRTAALKIMHDSNIGAMGAAAIFICLLVKFGCINSIPFFKLNPALVLAAVLSRWSFVFSALNWPAVSGNDGLGKKFIGLIGNRELFYSSVPLFMAALFGFWLKGLFIIILLIIVIAVFNGFLTKKIGGLTGDTLGAVGEITETVTLVAISAIIR